METGEGKVLLPYTAQNHRYTTLSCRQEAYKRFCRIYCKKNVMPKRVCPLTNTF